MHILSVPAKVHVCIREHKLGLHTGAELTAAPGPGVGKSHGHARNTSQYSMDLGSCA